MIKRIITAVVSICILVPVLLLSDTVVFPIAIAIVGLVSLFEMYRCMGMDKKLSFCLPGYLFALAFPFLMRYCDDILKTVGIAFIAMISYLIYLFYLAIKARGGIEFGSVGKLFAITAYILLAMNSIIYIRDFEGGGVHLYLLIFIGAWVTDTFAYFTGMLLGKHKLIPEVSPKKTVEGSIGGTVASALAFVAFGIITDKFFGTNANIVFLAVSGIIVALVAQIGDLIMSVIKRESGIKDYGNIFPGHGGMIDRFDSVLAVSLVLCAICVFAKITGILLI